MYPDADRKDNEALRNFFSTHTTVAGTTSNLIVRTFKTVCEIADFGAEQPTVDVSDEKSQVRAKEKPVTESDPLKKPFGPAININIQLQIPATEDARVYDSFFAAMKKKHLFPGE